jgi:hypothetical protein
MGNGVEINKRRLRFSCRRQGTTFVLFQAISQSGQKHMFWIAFFGSFLGETRNEQKRH